LNPGSQHLPIRYKGGHGPDTDLSGFFSISLDHFCELTVFQRSIQRLCIKTQIGCQLPEYSDIADVFAMLEKGSEKRKVVLASLERGWIGGRFKGMFILAASG
jgi:hypothetical protein